jgi:16S rRNA (uracil1498-N3)-methyltransferase
MSERFFSSEPILSGRATLTGPEAHHLLHVMRIRPGEPVKLFDDSGAEFAAVVESLGRATVDVRIVERLEITRELPFSLAVGVALPKGDRQRWLVEKLTELGVTKLVPLVTERSVAQPTSSVLDRLRRAVIEASKQCGRNRLMKIDEPQTWAAWLSHKSIAGDLRSPTCRYLVAHPGGTPLSKLDFTNPLPTCLTIGPEGGLTDQEIAAALAAGWQFVDLGPRILRVETAAIALASAITMR